MTAAAAPRTLPMGRGAAVLAHVNRAPLASALALLAIIASAAAVAVVAGAEAWDSHLAGQLVVDSAVGASYPSIGAVVLSAPAIARGTRSLGWVLVAAGTASSLNALCTALALTARNASTPVEVLVQVQSWLWVPGFMPLLTLVPLLYPDGLLPGRRWRAAAMAAGAGIVLMSAGVALYPEPFTGRITLDKPFTSLVAAQVATVTAAALLVPAGVAAVASLVTRYRRSAGLRRRQVSVLLAAAGFLLTVTLLQDVLPSPYDALAQAVAVVTVPVAIGVAVTRHRLYELDTAVRRAIVAGSLAVCLAGLYLTLFTLAQAVAPEGSALGAAIAAGLTGVVVQPLARRLSIGVDRLFYGDRADPYAVSTRLSARLATSGLDVDEVPQVVCDTIVDSLRLGAAEVSVLVGTERRVLAVAGEPRADVPATSFELRHRGEHVGSIAVAPRPGDAALEARDVEVVAAIADQAAPSLAAHRLHEQLQLSRQSLVSAREQERLRLRRELHDGLGATLAGVRLQVESARSYVDDPQTARLLDSATGGVIQAVAEVRTLTNDLRPPALDEVGLTGALELLADRSSTATTRVVAHVAALPEIDPAVEVAAYRIAAEALANAVRHSGAGSVQLEVEAPRDLLVVSVVDDGAGLVQSEHSGSGLGLASMRTRAEEIGGSLVLTSTTTGLRVRAELPRRVKVAAR